MNIALVASHTRIPSTMANAVAFMKTASALASQGADTELIVEKGSSARSQLSNGNLDEWEYYGVPRNFRITHLLAIPPWFRYKGLLEAPFYLLHIARQSRRVLLWSQHLWTAYLGSHLGIPTVVDLHEPISVYGEKMVGRLIKMANVQRLSARANSNSLAEQLKSVGFPETRILALHNGVDAQAILPRASLVNRRSSDGLPDADAVVLYTGKVHSERGIDLILEAAAQLPEARFVLLGGDRDSVLTYSGLARSMNLSNVEFRGFVPHREVLRYTREADVLLAVYTSSVRTVEIMCPMKVFEYMASGRPIVASDFPVMHEVLEHEVNALLVEPESAEELTGGIKRLLDDPGLGRGLAQQALEDVRACSWDARAEQFLRWLPSQYQPQWA